MENLPKTSQFGLVLAGGRSARMGQDKAALIHPDGRTLARRAWDLLRAAGCESVVLSLRENQPIPPGFEDISGPTVVRDVVGKGSGPLTGIVSAMQAYPAADWIVIACDMPQLEVEALKNLLDSKRVGESFLAYRSASQGEPEPLCAFYATTARELLESEIKGQARSLRTVLIENHCRLLDLSSPAALGNCNTPEEWTKAIEEPILSVWQADLLEIWISPGNNFRGRHGHGPLDYEVQRLLEIECVAGQGLRGDRYFGYKENFKGQVTFLQAETLIRLRDHFGLPELSAGVLRRNLVVQGVDLREWAGRKFLYQGIAFEGAEECKPCYWMDQAVAPGAEEFLKDHFQGGLRARILTSGILKATVPNEA